LTIKSTSHTNTFFYSFHQAFTRLPLLADATFYALIYLCL
jgi:hypothetical protein